MDDDAALRGGDVAALQRRLHSEINPDFFSSNFRPMMQLVSILSAEARGRAGAPEPAEEGGDGAGDLKVFTLEGSVVRLKIVGVRTDATGMFAVGTIKGDFLGVHDEDA